MVWAALAFAALLPLRDADALAAFSILAGGVLLVLAAGRAGTGWVLRSRLGEVAAAGVRVVLLVVAGPLGWGSSGSLPATAGDSAEPGRTPVIRILARGGAMALLPLGILAALLTSADPVFDALLQATLVAGVAPLLEHLAAAGVMAWLAAGYMRALLVPDDPILERIRLPRPSFAPAELAVVLFLLSLLLLAFLGVQVRYLVGGAGLVEVTAGLSYAEYARRGFFELVTAVALVLPVLLAADFMAARNDPGGRRLLRAASTLLLFLLGGVVASAAYRMYLYQAAYGLTEARLYVSVVLVWLAVVLAWFGATVLRGQRRGFAFGAIAAGLACVAALHLLNPHALIARVNLTRAAAGSEVDASYLRTLGADAAPTLMAHLSSLPETERCIVQALLVERWSGARPGGWRNWNLGDARARSAVSGLPRPGACPTPTTPQALQARRTTLLPPAPR